MKRRVERVYPKECEDKHRVYSHYKKVNKFDELWGGWTLLVEEMDKIILEGYTHIKIKTETTIFQISIEDIFSHGKIWPNMDHFKKCMCDKWLWPVRACTVSKITNPLSNDSTQMTL